MVSVWETYREPFEVFLPPSEWAHYPQWNDPRRLPHSDDLPDGARHLLRYPGFVEYASDLLQPDFFPNSTAPLVGQDGGIVRYEVAINQAFFTYVRNFRYFDCNQQIADVELAVQQPECPSVFQPPPFGDEDYVHCLPVWARQGTVDVKAAWLPLDPAKDRFERYLHREIVTPGGVQVMGLVAFHILRFTPNGKQMEGRIAATFEQIDNVSVDHCICGEESPGCQGTSLNPPPQGHEPLFNTGAPPSEI